MHTPSLFQVKSSSKPMSSSALSEKYRPKRFVDFIGLEKPKQVLQKYATTPFDSAWLFVGPAGSGKTAMTHVLAGEISAELHTLSAPLTREEINRLCERCSGFPVDNLKRHLALVNQADKLSRQNQFDFRSQLDGPSSLENVVWVFTATTIEELDLGFVSRCHKLNFSTHGISREAALLLERIWESETKDDGRAKPNFARIVKESKNCIRTAVNALEMRLLEMGG